uniref:PDEase domain-containing protein n=1 Tax=Macrostomum lignano TaxID=282301 RepID=A0A1I8IWV1_9PLAT
EEEPDEEPLPPILLAIPTRALAFLEQSAHQWDFDPFALTDMTGERPIRSMGLYLFHQFDLTDKFGIQLPVLEAFLDLVEEGYKRHGNPYHNCTHSADVAQTCCFILSRHGLASWLSDIEVLALLFAALIHDFEHTGTTNNYHVQSRSQLAVVYNDKSVLESYHVSAVFRKMHEQGPKYRQFRSLVIEMVLATDMSTHFAQVTAMKDAIPCPENLPRVDILAYILHAADISHPAKIWRLHERWTGKLTAEFFAQGDREKELGLACSPLCDRDKTMVASSQVGFIEYIVEPCFHTLLQLLQSVKFLLNPPRQTAPGADSNGESGSSRGGDDEDGEVTGSRPTNPTPDTMDRLRDLHDWDVLSILCSNRDRWRDLAESEKRRVAVIDEVNEEEEQEEEAEN